ncbi:MAG TPA: DUF2092 domain-containing protein [Candidatus Margulisiibacteriota bacterium]|nr:DUF2092 domain-containing protein [Candidatus Margulisiibacteriota bacterium]
MIRPNSYRWMLPLAFSVLLTAAGAGAQDAPQATPKAPRAAKRAQSPRKAAVPAVEPVLEPKAIDILKAACARLAAARSMVFTAVVSYENPSRLGPPLVYTTKSQVALQRPDKLKVITSGDGPASEFYYDGKTMMAFEPAANLVAVADAPPTIDATLQAAFDSAAIYFPFTDVIVADPYADIADGLKVAFYIGQSHVVGGTTTDMLAYANNDVFIQIWIGAEDKLPRMVRAVYRKDPAQLRHQLELSDWQLDGPLAADAFASSKAASAAHIEFADPAKLPPGLRPPIKGRPPMKGKAAKKPQ